MINEHLHTNKVRTRAPRVIRRQHVVNKSSRSAANKSQHTSTSDCMALKCIYSFGHNDANSCELKCSWHPIWFDVFGHCRWTAYVNDLCKNVIVTHTLPTVWWNSFRLHPPTAFCSSKNFWLCGFPSRNSLTYGAHMSCTPYTCSRRPTARVVYLCRRAFAI